MLRKWFLQWFYTSLGVSSSVPSSFGSLLLLPLQVQISPFSIKMYQLQPNKIVSSRKPQPSSPTAPGPRAEGTIKKNTSALGRKQLQNGSFCLFFFYQRRDESSINICHVSSCNPPFLFPPKLLQFRVTLIFKVDKNHKTLPVVGRIREYIMLFSRWDLNKQ